jgi:hypothetical protein
MVLRAELELGDLPEDPVAIPGEVVENCGAGRTSTNPDLAT